jgi:Domain of unknown function (DUF4390)
VTRRLALVSALIVAGTALPAQRRPRVDVQLPPRAGATSDGPLVRSLDVLTDKQMRDLLRSGFPARLRFRVELWTAGGWFNNLAGSTEWNVVVRFDPLNQRYRVARIVGDRVSLLGQFDSLADAEAAVERPYRADLAPGGDGRRYYYNVVLDVETLSLSDLDEVERWLRGELRPAVRGERNPGTALTRGLRTLFVRLLGGERRHYEQRSPTFPSG